MEHIIFFASQSEFHQWLLDHHSTKTECWVGIFKKGSGNKGITYREAADEALCFGWVEAVRKKMDVLSYTIRFVPRNPRSPWSKRNIERMEELISLGLAHPSGIVKFEERRPPLEQPYSYENRPNSFPASYEVLFQEHQEAWNWFTTQAPSYQRVAIFWVLKAKKEETRKRRLDQLIRDSGERIRVKPLRRKDNK